MKKTVFTQPERQTVNMGAFIFALRLFGLFMILPVFSLYAFSLHGATNTNVSITLGLYGLAALIFQPLFGALSDRYGRKMLIAIGLSIFIIGSLIASLAHNIEFMMLGRFLQGGGSIGSVLMALIADHTRDEVRTKAMATIGVTLTLAFIFSIVLAPILVPLIHLSGLFAISACLGVIGLILTLFLPITPPHIQPHVSVSEPLLLLLKNQDFFILSMSVFILHLLLIATFTALPLILTKTLLLDPTITWLTYLPALVIAFMGMILLIIIAERFHELKRVTILSILLMLLGLLFFWGYETSYGYTFVGIVLFFIGFITLEALLPSWLTRIIPQNRKGAGMGIYSMMQFLGAFVGGCLGAVNQINPDNLFLWTIAISALWFLGAMRLNPLRKKSLEIDTVESP